MGIMSPLLPTYAVTMGASGTMLGLIFGIFSLTRACAMPFSGTLSDRFGRKPFIVAGLIIQTLAAVSFLACTSPWQLLAARMFQGLAGALEVPISMALIGEISPPGKESYYMGWFSAAIFFGFGAGPMLGGTIKDHLSFSANFIFLGSLCFIALLAVGLGLREKDVVARQAKSRQVISYRQLLKNPIMKALFAFRLVDSFARGTVSAFLPLFGEQAAHLTATRVGLVLSANILTSASFQPVFGYLADRYDRRKFIIVGILIQVGCLLSIPHALTFINLLSINFAMGLAGAMSNSAAAGIITSEGKKGAMGGSMAIFNIGMSLGLAGGPIVGGVMNDLLSFPGTFYFAALVAFLGAVLTFWMTRRRPENGMVPFLPGQ